MLKCIQDVLKVCQASVNDFVIDSTLRWNKIILHKINVSIGSSPLYGFDATVKLAAAIKQFYSFITVYYSFIVLLLACQSNHLGTFNLH